MPEVLQKWADTGLVSLQLELSSIPYPQAGDLIFTNKGPLAEQFVGQQLRAAQSPLSDPALFYWQRTGHAKKTGGACRRSQMTNACINRVRV
jgi:hypothetical protein